MGEGTKILTTGAIAKYCSVHFRTVIRWIEKGHLKSYKLPGRGDNRVRADDFLEFLREHQMPIPEDLQDRSRRILIVEDEASVAKAMQRVLRRAGFETETASDGFVAGAQACTFAPSVITLDLMMPLVGGLDVLKFIRGSEVLKEVKVLVVSALDKKELDKALEEGADDILAKPFKNQELIEKVSRLAGVEATAGPLAQKAI
jgi:excisionase family DNA binding protein